MCPVGEPVAGMSDVATHRSADTDELLLPGHLLRDGLRDPFRLLVVWYIRKSAYWLAFVGSTVAHVQNRTDEATVDWSDPQGVWDELWSPLVAVVLAVVVRLVASVAGLVLAYPLVLEYERQLEARTGPTRWISTVLDRRNLASALRKLRFSHHVRQQALARLGERGKRMGRLDPILDIVNAVSFLVLVAVIAIGAGS